MPASVSVIIPTLNEEAVIRPCIRTVLAQDPDELIVTDGGSVDRTIKIAREEATLVQSERGRARQMNTGAQQASGDILLFLHADTILPERGLEAVRLAVQHSGYQSGIFRLGFNRDAALLRFYERCTKLNLPQLCFGDRAIFVRRSLFESIGGYPDVPIFEDLELVLALHRRGGFCFLPQRVTTSARRFEKNGHLAQQLLNGALYLGYVLGIAPHRLAKFYDYSH